MRPEPVKEPQERDETDESLRLERARTDDELSRREASLEKVTAAAAQRARDRAHDLLETARKREDQKLERAGAAGDGRRALAHERALADSALQGEQALVSKEVLDESRERARALSQLLRLEREMTDERLLTERERGDAGLRARDDFMGMVTHDLRTLLGAVALTLETQARTRPRADDVTEQRELRMSRRLQHLTARMNRLIGDLVDVSAIEAGRFEISPRAHDARVLLKDSLEVFLPVAAAKGVSLETTAPPSPLGGKLDAERILQVLANLISNAIKFTEQGGQVSLAVEQVEGALRFAVADTGRGVAPDHLNVIFERFWQVKKGDRGGLGLGLFISQQIVAAHGGRIWAQSEPGKGSTFFFTLPTTAASSYGVS